MAKFRYRTNGGAWTAVDEVLPFTVPGATAADSVDVEAIGATVSLVAAIRIAPISATEAYIIAPHATLGAMALHLIHGNGADMSTPAASVGAPFGAWRIRGFRALPSVASDPATQATEVIYDGIGSQELAIQLGSEFSGQYHGFGPGATYSQTAPDLTVAGYLSAATIASGGRMFWDGGEYADWSGSITLNPDGSISTTMAVDMPFDALIAYLDMTIANSGFSMGSLDGGATWTDLTTLAINARLTANVASIILRNPSTGTMMTVADNALGVAGFQIKEIQRRSGDYKIYPNINPQPAGTPLGDVSVSRTITFSAGEPDPPSLYIWDGATDGATGYNLSGANSSAGGVTFDDVNDQIVLTRSAGGGAGVYNRVTFAMSGLTIGAQYSVAAIMAVEGGSPSGGTSVLTSVNLDGGSGTSMTPGTASAGTPSFTFTATAELMYLSLTQNYDVSSDNVLRVGRIGPVTAL